MHGHLPGGIVPGPGITAAQESFPHRCLPAPCDPPVGLGPLFGLKVSDALYESRDFTPSPGHFYVLLGTAALNEMRLTSI